MGIILLPGGAVAVGAVVVGAENMRVGTQVLVVVIAGIKEDNMSLQCTCIIQLFESKAVKKLATETMFGLNASYAKASIVTKHADIHVHVPVHNKSRGKLT